MEVTESRKGRLERKRRKGFAKTAAGSVRLISVLCLGSQGPLLCVIIALLFIDLPACLTTPTSQQAMFKTHGLPTELAGQSSRICLKTC